MASYPTAVKTFTTKNDGAGNTISASHINDIQDEVTALETGLLNGTAPLNSSNSTVVNLSVSGNSTLANLTVTNALTLTNLQLSGDSTIAGELFVLKKPPSVRVISTTGMAVAHNTLTPVTFNSWSFISTSSMHSTASNPSRLIPPSSGVYSIIASAYWQTVSTISTAFTQLGLRLNGSIFVALDRRINSTAGFPAGPAQSVQTYCDLSTSDYVEVVAYQSHGSTMSLGFANDYSPVMCMVKIR